jgi:hypothetical protein
MDSRDLERHAEDVAFLVSLISDPLHLARQLKGCDRKRLQVLNTLIGPRSHPVSASLGAGAGDAYAAPHPRELVHSLTASADEQSRADAGPRSSLNGLASQQTETQRDTRDDPGKLFGQNVHLPRMQKRPAS